jgi:uncharacterized membrane protein YfhO
MADFYVAGKPVTSKVDYTYLYEQQGSLYAQTLELRTDGELVDYSADRPALLPFNTFYYPGWHAYLLDRDTDAVIKELSIALRSDLGLMTVRVPAGKGRVLLQFEATPIRKLGGAVTLTSLALVVILVLAGLAIWVRKPRRR